MVYGIVKQHSGYILCRSEIGKGTIFRIYFPAIPSTKIVDVNTSGEMPIMGTETILLVEDEFLVRELGERTLRGHGYEVLTATNGQEALEIFVRLRDRISLIILDMIMPTMSGRDCLKKILEIDPNARVLIASGHSAETSLAECIELGAKEFIPKPFRFTKLLKLIRTILDEDETKFPGFKPPGR
jgi:DNA-binding NtrC family response regulator